MRSGRGLKKADTSVFDSRESTIAGHFRSKRDQRELLCRVMRPWSSQPTKLSGDFDRKKCYDPTTPAFGKCKFGWSARHFLREAEHQSTRENRRDRFEHRGSQAFQTPDRDTATIGQRKNQQQELCRPFPLFNLFVILRA